MEWFGHQIGVLEAGKRGHVEGMWHMRGLQCTDTWRSIERAAFGPQNLDFRGAGICYRYPGHRYPGNRYPGHRKKMARCRDFRYTVPEKKNGPRPGFPGGDCRKKYVCDARPPRSLRTQNKFFREKKAPGGDFWGLSCLVSP